MISILIRKFIVRNFYFLINPIRKFYRRLIKAKTKGVKCLLKNGDKFLLIRNSYGIGHWTMPGGGIKKGETPDEAVCREVKEEVGFSIDNPLKIGFYLNLREGIEDTVHCFFKEVEDRDFVLDQIEIAEARWFKEEEFPVLQSHSVSKAMNMYKNYLNNNNDR